MTKAPISLQDLRRRLYAKAKANNGAPGPDGVTFEAIESAGVEAFLEQIQGELEGGTYPGQSHFKLPLPILATSTLHRDCKGVVSA